MGSCKVGDTIGTLRQELELDPLIVVLCEAFPQINIKLIFQKSDNRLVQTLHWLQPGLFYATMVCLIWNLQLTMFNSGQTHQEWIQNKLG